MSLGVGSGVEKVLNLQLDDNSETGSSSANRKLTQISVPSGELKKELWPVP
jgi:small nuclear ribonucleoprotein (snRNP)-like protein